MKIRAVVAIIVLSLSSIVLAQQNSPRIKEKSESLSSDQKDETNPDVAFPTGQIIEKVIVHSDASQSYAAYLPSNYTEQRKWAIIFCFDPLARGKFAVGHFQAAAEKNGFIIVCSNNSRNGLNSELISKTLTSFWNDVHSRFSLDDKRVYAAGFSGGARLASRFAVNCRNCLAGLIGVGAGFAPGLSPANLQTPLVYFGAMGVDDFNYGEMRELEKKLGQFGVPHHFESFAGGHEWFSVTLAEHALEWFKFRAMKDKLIKVDEKFIEEYFQLRQTEAENLLASNQPLEAYQRYQSLIEDFQNARDVKSVMEAAQKLKDSSSLRRNQQAEEDQFNQERQIEGEINSIVLQLADTNEKPFARQEFRGKIEELRKKKEMPEDTPQRRVARRVLMQVYIRAIETANFLLTQKNYGLAVVNFTAAREITPADGSIVYELGRSYALGGQHKAALETLEEAIQLGFKDLPRLQNEAAFARISQQTRFQKIVKVLESK